MHYTITHNPSSINDNPLSTYKAIDALYGVVGMHLKCRGHLLHLPPSLGGALSSCTKIDCNNKRKGVNPANKLMACVDKAYNSCQKVTSILDSTLPLQMQLSHG